MTMYNREHPYIPNKYEIAGFELVGWLTPKGIIIGATNQNDRGELVNEFPSHVELNGVIYTLEYIKYNNNDNIKEYGLVWGIYA